MAKRNSAQILEEVFPLANGATIPKLGFGTWLIPPDKAAQCTKDAIATGYRLIDTAQAYGNEKETGDGIRESGVARDELFVVDKVAAELKDYDSVLASIQKSVALMDVGPLDMMLIHSPQPWNKVNQSNDRYFEGNREAWRAMEHAVDSGLVKGIGLANFEIQDVENIMESCKVVPAIDQILCHAGHTPLHLLNWLHAKDIRVMAYSPLGHGAVLSSPTITKLAQEYEVTPAQILIRYDVQLGAVPIVKAMTPEHMKDDAMVHFRLSDEDEKMLRHWEYTDGYGQANAFPVFGGKL